MKKPLAALLVWALVAIVPASAQVQPSLPGVMAYPSLWHVKTGQGEVYLLGAVHILPPDLRWRTPAISRAVSRSDVFVFEMPEDERSQAELQGMVQAKGYLPPGQSLRAELRDSFLADYDAALAAAGLPPAQVDRERPWLADLHLMLAQMARHGYGRDNGVDSVLMAEAGSNHKQMRYFETVAEQFALLAPDDPKLELQEFEADLKDLRDVAADMQPMVKAWSAGDQIQLDKLINGDLDPFPEVRKMLLDDRNRRWVPKIEAMLREKHVFFITVGAGHLTGPTGVPALLRADGYKVDGP
jgi:uncharacterized protein YbaP (TraB family)